MTFPVYQGGLPAIRTRYRQRGSGFFSTLKRYALPLLRKAAPIAGSAALQLLTGHKPKDVLFSSAKKAGSQILNTFATPDEEEEEEAPELEKYIKGKRRGKAARKQKPVKRRRKNFY